MKPPCEIDHIIVTAPSLEIGGAYVFERLGVYPQKGGEHARMGTHNLLLSLGKSAYLEVMAINPAAPQPATPRWFGLDDMPKDAPARLSTWVARTANLSATVQASVEPMRQIVPMSRGALNWLITSPDSSPNTSSNTTSKSGDATHGGLTPTLIEWQTDAHPAGTLPDVGLALMQLEFFTADTPRIERQMKALGLLAGWSASAVKAGEPPRLRAQIQTLRGIRDLG